jgi:cell wall-associated NlpC family hydrolase
VADGGYRPARMLLAVAGAALITAASTSAVRADPRPTIAQVESRVAALYRSAEEASERYNDARLALTDAERKLAQAQRSVAGQLAIVAQKQRLLGVMAASAYRSGGIDPQLQLVFADDPEQFLHRASALDLLSRQQSANLRQAATARLELQAEQAQAAQRHAAVDALRRALSQHKAAIDENLRAAQQQLNSLRAAERERLARIAAERERLARIAAERERLAAERQRLAQQAAEQRAAARASRTPTPSRTTARTSTASRPSSPATQPAPAPASGRAAVAVRFAYAQLGDRYVYGAAGPDAWDCSGLTMMAWRAAGVSLPHSSRGQYSVGAHVSRSQLQPGDLVFFYSPISHVGIYVGNGNIIHAPNPSRRVEVAPISSMPYTGATRVG